MNDFNKCKLNQYQIPGFPYWDQMAIGVVNFKNKQIDFKTYPDELPVNHLFDLASLTKPLTISPLYWDRQELFDEKDHLLLEHRGGLPAYAKLQKSSWKGLVANFPIFESQTLYSDLSFLRLKINLEEKTNSDLSELTQTYLSNYFTHWTKLNDRRVDDDNAFIIGGFCPHAGLFGSIENLLNYLLFLNSKFNFIEKLKNKMVAKYPHRFIEGFDRIFPPTKAQLSNTLAGSKASIYTIGHLGFTGTSFWIDCEKLIGQVILTNVTKWFSYNRIKLNCFRKGVANDIWSFFC